MCARRDFGNSVTHNRIVSCLAHMLECRGWSVSADIQSYPNPREINKHIPDVYAEMSTSTSVRKIIIEVETCDTVYEKHCLDQLRAFCSVPDAEVWLAIPTECSGLALIGPSNGSVPSGVHVVFVDLESGVIKGTPSLLKQGAER